MKKIPVFGIKEFLPERLEESLLYVNDLKNHLASHKFINVPHSHQTFITILFTSGHGIHQIDFKSYPVAPGDVFLMSPGQIHSWSLSADTDGFVIFHTASFYNDFFADHKIDNFPFFFLSHNYPVIRISGLLLQQSESFFREILAEFRGDSELKHFSIITWLNLLYIKLTRVYKADVLRTENESQIRIRRLSQLVDEHFRTLKLPKEYADLLHITTRHLSRMCNEILNKTTTDIIHERILLEAKRLLIHSPGSVSQISYALGYEDVSYFIRFFRHKTGISPKQFRQARKDAVWVA